MAEPARSSDLEELQAAEQKLLSALETANQVASLLSSGGSQQELERLCSSFVADTQESQLALLRLADKHQQPLPFQNNDYRQRLQLGAAQKQLEAAEAQLAGLPAGCGAAAGLADAGAGGAAPAAAAAALAGVVAAAGGQAE